MGFTKDKLKEAVAHLEGAKLELSNVYMTLGYMSTEGKEARRIWREIDKLQDWCTLPESSESESIPAAQKVAEIERAPQRRKSSARPRSASAAQQQTIGGIIAMLKKGRGVAR
jgi:hypothetical protein